MPVGSVLMKLKKPGRPQDPARRERRREEILEAAARLFAEHGYSETDTQGLADLLQVGKGTLYRYFRTKRELFLAAGGPAVLAPPARGARHLRPGRRPP